MTAKLSKISTSIRWCETRGGDYAATSRGKQIPLFFVVGMSLHYNSICRREEKARREPNYVSTSDPSSLAFSIRAARQAALEPITSVLLAGGPDVIPFFTLPSPVLNDEDTQIATDNPYGCATGLEASYPAPDIPVGRAVGVTQSSGMGASDFTLILFPGFPAF
jgi:hypothetical protein